MSAQPSLAIYRLNLYNPGRMTDAEIVAAFIARRSQFDRIVADLAAESATSRAQHHLIVGQRGMGKTTLLLRLAAELRGEPLGERFLPLVFSEEQYAVDRLSKFWMNCLDSLADALERTGGEAGAQKIAAQEIDVTVRKLQAGLADRKRVESVLAREALDAFLEAAGKTQRRPVLLVDNIQLVFENLDDQQQHVLREVLQRPGAPVLVAASPAPPPESQDYGAAFYDQFKTYYLPPLDLGEMRELLAALAKSAGRDDVATRVRQNPGRIAALHQLTGGNPRTTVLLFHLYAEDFAPTVFGDLEQLLDRVTPLYKARFEELSPQMQVVAGAMANHWDPIAARQLAEATGLAPNQVSPQLDRLQKLGWVEEVELFGTARAGYQIAERFFNVWFLMRSASRRQRRQIEFLTRFLEAFYAPADRRRLASPFLDEALVAAYDANWGIAREKLRLALEEVAAGFPSATQDDWMQATAVLLHLDYGNYLLALLEERGDDQRLRPWYEAIRAHQVNDRRYLLNVAAEVRPAAESYYDHIARRLALLPESTRRRGG